jgi:CheY-like chemotaxis protein
LAAGFGPHVDESVSPAVLSIKPGVVLGMLSCVSALDVLRATQTVAVATDPVDAAQVVWAEHDGRFDLLLTDMVMPGGMTGVELAEPLLAKKPGLRIILTKWLQQGVVRLRSGKREGPHLYAQAVFTAGFGGNRA